MFPATGSTAKQAIFPGYASKTALAAVKSLYDTSTVQEVTDAGTPGLLGVPRVRAPLPACTSSPSAWPW